MSSLTPATRSGEAASAATHEGFVNGVLTLIPTCGALYVAMQKNSFRSRTNWQSRTAMAIMPALFVFGWTSEHKLSHKMKEIAQESRHTAQTVDWAEQELARHAQTVQRRLTKQDTELHLSQLYQQSIMESGVHIVPGDSLGYHHLAANYAQEHPIQVLAAFAVPAVATIFYGRTGKEHLQFSMKLLHTRVFGQFATISLLLTIMGFKEYMDRHGKFITQAQADARVAEMQRVRAALQERLEREEALQQAAKRELALAHEQDLQDELSKKAGSN